jgi:hypothetical protein
MPSLQPEIEPDSIAEISTVLAWHSNEDSLLLYSLSCCCSFAGLFRGLQSFLSSACTTLRNYQRSSSIASASYQPNKASILIPINYNPTNYQCCKDTSFATMSKLDNKVVHLGFLYDLAYQFRHQIISRLYKCFVNEFKDLDPGPWIRERMLRDLREQRNWQIMDYLLEINKANKIAFQTCNNLEAKIKAIDEVQRRSRILEHAGEVMVNLEIRVLNDRLDDIRTSAAYLRRIRYIHAKTIENLSRMAHEGLQNELQQQKQDPDGGV